MESLSYYLEICPADIRAGMRKRCFATGEVILSPGFCGDQVFLLTSGQAKLTAQRENGQTVVLSLYNNWELLGELEAFTGSVCEKSIIALMPCEVLVISRDEFFRWLQVDFAFNRYILNLLSCKLQRLSATSQISMSGFLRERVVHILLTNMTSSHHFPYGKHILAESVGTSIRSLNRVLEQFIKENIISVSASRIHIKNPTALCALAESDGRNSASH